MVILTKCCQATGERDVVQIAVDEPNLVRREGKSRKVRRAEEWLGVVAPCKTPVVVIVDVGAHCSLHTRRGGFLLLPDGVRPVQLLEELPGTGGLPVDQLGERRGGGVRGEAGGDFLPGGGAHVYGAGGEHDQVWQQPGLD